jgi:acyl-CoA synthetase (NDP forming)
MTLPADILATPGIQGAEATRQLLDAAAIPMVRDGLASSAREAAEIAGRIGFPVVLKLASPAFPHRTDLGLVALDVQDAAAAEAMFETLVERARNADPGAQIDGVQVQRYVEGGVEMLVGLVRDPHLGPALTIGAGGIYAEILRDVAVRPLPVDETDIRAMIAGLRIAPLLAGARGRAPCDLDAFVRLAMAAARLGLAAGERLAELDLNPVIVLPGEAIAVDALAVAA